MRYLPWFVIGLLVGSFAPPVWTQDGVAPIPQLPGRVDSQNALVVTMVSVGAAQGPPTPIANLPGRVDSANALIVTCPDLTCGGGGGLTLPVIDTTNIVKGSVDMTKLLRFEIDGFTAGANRVATFPDADITVAGINLAQSWTANQTYATGDIIITANTSNLNFGGTANTFNRITVRTVNTPDTASLMTGSTANSWLVTESADLNFDFAHALQTNPTVFIHSTNQSTTEWISLTHNATDGVIDVGTGTVSFADAVKATSYQAADGSAGITGSGCGAFEEGICTAAGGSSAAPFTDTTSIVEGSADGTKELRFEVDGFTTATIRTATFPDDNITVARIDAAQTFTGTQTYSGTVILGNGVTAIGTSAGGTQNWIRNSVAQTPDAGQLNTGSQSNSWLIVETGDSTFDFAHALQTNPTLFIHSLNQSTTQWISFTHDATNGVIDVGTGLVSFTDVIKATGYQSSDGSAGITGASCASFKNGLCVG